MITQPAADKIFGYVAPGFNQLGDTTEWLKNYLNSLVSEDDFESNSLELSRSRNNLKVLSNIESCRHIDVHYTCSFCTRGFTNAEITRGLYLDFLEVQETEPIFLNWLDKEERIQVPICHADYKEE